MRSTCTKTGQKVNENKSGTNDLQNNKNARKNSGCSSGDTWAVESAALILSSALSTLPSHWKLKNKKKHTFHSNCFALDMCHN